jgi:hypothetical protein
MDSRIFRRQLQRSKLIELNFFYTIKKLLRIRCLKWACMTHLGIKSISYGQKKGRESNCQFDSRRLKVGNCLDLVMFRWCAKYHWKSLNEGYNFFLNLTSIRGLKKVMGLPSRKNPNFENFGIPNLGVLGQNDIWV